MQLALTSPEDTMIVGFNVVPDDAALALAEERGVQIREYNIIYKLTDDIKAALEGKLKPRRGGRPPGPGRRPRDVQDQPGRHHRRLLRHAGRHRALGQDPRHPRRRRSSTRRPRRTAGLESLKRFKDDVREVREGFECGMKIAGYDDIKVGDVIEAYRIEQVQRTLNRPRPQSQSELGRDFGLRTSCMSVPCECGCSCGNRRA